MSVDVITLYLNPCVGSTLTQGGNPFKLVPSTKQNRSCLKKNLFRKFQTEFKIIFIKAEEVLIWLEQGVAIMNLDLSNEGVEAV